MVANLLRFKVIQGIQHLIVVRQDGQEHKSRRPFQLANGEFKLEFFKSSEFFRTRTHWVNEVEMRS
ncbi:MAG: hypothetical protein OXG15_13065 [Gammaproteobacteria bacterium]|nr:hypothetical protein [Gammaproteobacteria bacterium]